jgi:hypothetical protein
MYILTSIRDCEWLQVQGILHHEVSKPRETSLLVCKFLCLIQVDYYFGIVDVSSAMKRVESSKEAGRNLVVIDPDGSTEWQSVKLTPAKWYVFHFLILMSLICPGRLFAETRRFSGVQITMC